MAAEREGGRRPKLLHLNTVMERYGRRGSSARRRSPERRATLWRTVVDWVTPPSAEVQEAGAAEEEQLTEQQTAERPTVELPSTKEPEALSSIETADNPVAVPEDPGLAASQPKGPVRGGAAAARADHTEQWGPEMSSEPSPRAQVARPPSASRHAPWIGLDFGNHRCSAATFDERFEVLVGRSGQVALPSLVALARPKGVLVGRAALQYAMSTGRPIAGGLRRLLERPARELRYFDDGGLALVDETGEVFFRAGSELYSVVDLVAMLFTVLRQRACRTTGAQVDRAVLAVPATFGAAARAAVQAAANEAGLSVMGMLTEPSAALVGIGLRGRNGQALVCDFGSSFKFSLVEMSGKTFTIITAGDEPILGGEQVDYCLAAQFAERFRRERGVDLREHSAAWQRLLLACSAAKQAAWHSSGARLQVELPELSQTLSYWLSREQAQAQLAPLVDDALQMVNERFAELKQDCPELCVVVGGLAEVPFVRERTAKMLRRSPIAPHPSEAVLRGVAFRAAELCRAASRTTRALPRKIGIAVRHQVVTLFDRNTPLPAELHHTLFTDRDDQTEIELAVCLGEERGWQVLGQLRYRGIDPRPAGEGKVELRFEIDEEGDLDVRADIDGTTQHISLKR